VYAFSDGFKLPLTPLMLREWAIALVNYIPFFMAVFSD
jgi:hypothetical protein